MKGSLSLLTASALLAAAGLAYAGGAGQEPMNFLFLDAGARPVAMGGAYTALAADSNALLYNPAGLGAAKRCEATFMHSQHFNSATQEYVGLSLPRGFGAGLNYVSYGRAIPRTTISNPAGTGDSFSITDLALAGGYGRSISSNVHVGAGLKLVRESIAEATAQGFALDLGVLAAVPAVAGLDVGFALQNIGPAVRYQHAGESLPLNARLGAAYAFRLKGRRSVVALDLSKERSEGPIIGFGAETVLSGVMPIRLGFSTRNDAGPGLTAGLGWIIKQFSIDYAMTPYGELGYAHRISVTMRWGERADKQSVEEMLAAKTFTEPSEAHFARADAFLQDNVLDQAVSELKAAQAKLGEDDYRQVRYHERMGRILLAKGKVDDAMESFQQAIMLIQRLGVADTFAAEAFAGVGRCLLEKKQAVKAADFFKKSLELRPTPETERFIRKELEKPESDNQPK